MPSTTDLREDPVFMRRFATLLVQLAVEMDCDGDSTLRNALAVCSLKARRQIAEEQAATPAQGELFKDLFG